MPDASPKPFGMITATAVLPRLTASRAAGSAGIDTFRFLSARVPATMLFEIVLLSWSTTDTSIRAGSLLSLAEKMDPKNDAIAIGTTKLRMTERRSPKKISRSLRTIPTSGLKLISRVDSFLSA